MSEWGLETHIEDLRAVLDLIPAAQQKGHVFLAGHSFGVTVAELYAACRFESDDKRGFDQIAGMVFLDGLMGGTPSAEEDFVSELASIRETDRYTTLPLLGIDVCTSAEIVALRTWFDPTGIVDDPVRDQTFEILFGLGPNEMPKATNIATLGLPFDSMHQPLSFSRTTLGTLTGGPTEGLRVAVDKPGRRHNLNAWIVPEPLQSCLLSSPAWASSTTENSYAESSGWSSLRGSGSGPGASSAGSATCSPPTWRTSGRGITLRWRSEVSTT